MLSLDISAFVGVDVTVQMQFLIGLCDTSKILENERFCFYFIAMEMGKEG